MSETKTMTKDPICGMAVDPATALHIERHGETSYFCSDACMQEFLSTSDSAPPDE
jgi:Cu+-exporting ATPase